eukprot:TRINITY_DN8397_c0_g1_i1.p1 TRINITY_DN8397_c0_g1~~TRINITY_DN8397_c0_g1_i1.p1  ORF type:complete len:786 (-),score=86.66 TRINITY_DN8397_c0_g1_i1:189-2339(-)
MPEEMQLAAGRTSQTRPSVMAPQLGCDLSPRSAAFSQRRNSEDGGAHYRSLPTEEYEALQDRDQTTSDGDELCCQARFKEALQSTAYQVIMAVLILGNAAVIGMETDTSEWPWWKLIENFFLAAFTFELFFKMFAYGMRGFFDPRHEDYCWHVFDFTIVMFGLIDVTVDFLSGGKMSNGFSSLFRMVRLLRVLRIIRIVKFLKQLYLLAFGLAEAIQAVLWVTILMTFVCYICAIVMVKTIGQPSSDDPHREFLVYHFGDVPTAMLTLFILMSSPNLPIYQDEKGLLESRPMLTIFLVGFITFGSFGMIALLTGVISESMFEKNEMRREETHLEDEERRAELSLRIEELFDSLDVDEEGEASLEATEQLMPDIARLFLTNFIDFTRADLADMMKLLDIDGGGTVSKDEFKAGLLMLAAGVRPISIQEIKLDVHMCRRQLEDVLMSIQPLIKAVEIMTDSPSYSSTSSVRSSARRGTRKATGHVTQASRSQSTTSQRNTSKEVRILNDCQVKEVFEEGKLDAGSKLDTEKMMSSSCSSDEMPSLKLRVQEITTMLREVLQRSNEQAAANAKILQRLLPLPEAESGATASSKSCDDMEKQRGSGLDKSRFEGEVDSTENGFGRLGPLANPSSPSAKSTLAYSALEFGSRCNAVGASLLSCGVAGGDTADEDGATIEINMRPSDRSAHHASTPSSARDTDAARNPERQTRTGRRRFMEV